jgi:hypothetical protein
VIAYTVASPPSAAITAPANGATYAQGQVVSSSFTCTEGAGGTGIASCLAQNGHPSGAPIDTSTTGMHTFKVTANSKDGLSGSSIVTYTVAAPPSASITTPADRQSFTLGQSVATSFSCREGAAGPGLSSCVDSNGATGGAGRLSTAQLGVFAYTVTATSKDGQATSTTIHYTVIAPSVRYSVTNVHIGRSGVVTFDVAFPSAGTVDVLETAQNFAKLATLGLPRPGPGRFAFARMHVTQNRAGTVHVTVRPDARGRRLVRRHPRNLTINLWVSYTPTGGTTAATLGHLHLRLPR